MAKALLIAAPASGSGKTTLTLGLLRAFKNRGVKVAAAKTGPDHIDPRFHALASGQPCFNLDPWAMSDITLQTLMSRVSQNADLVLVEGVMGLFDGPLGAAGSTADLAQRLKLPIVLAVDASHQGQSVAALVNGFAQFRTDTELAGLILNRVATQRHAQILKSALPPSPPLMGEVYRSEVLTLPSRHLGLVQAEEMLDFENFATLAASHIEQHLDLDRLAALAKPLLSPPAQHHVILPPLGQRIAIAQDVAFSFAYPHLLDDWQRQGAEILPFSPLRDEAPNPIADAIFLPGGYPELYAETLSNALTFMTALRQTEVLVYGECGGFMVMGQVLMDLKGQAYPMAGLLPHTTSFASRKLHLGYRQLKLLPGRLCERWPNKLNAHEFHYSSADLFRAAPLAEAYDSTCQSLGPFGLHHENRAGSYAHIICQSDPAP